MTSLKHRILDLWNSMSAKKRDASSWGVGGGEDSQGSSLSTINDPVYSQPTSAPAQPASQKTYPQVSAGSATAGKDDPVYSQAGVGSDKSKGNSDQINDPVYSQPTSAPAQPGSGTQASPGSGAAGKDDPVYSQAGVGGDQSKRNSDQINDPVYGQPQSISAAQRPPEPGPGKGEIPAADDPVYSQSKRQGNDGSINDPVYGQPHSMGAAQIAAQPGPGRGKIPAADDPVYSQSQAGGKSTVNDPVYGQPQSIPAENSSSQPGPGKGKVSAGDDPVYSQPQTENDATANDPVYGQSRSIPAGSTSPEPGPGKGKISAADDPVYSQPQTQNGSSVNNPVYGQPQTLASASSQPAPGPGTGKVSPSDDPVYSQSSTATSRLSQLTSQISPPQTESQPNTSRARKKKSKAADATALPDDYTDILTHLTTLRKIAQPPDLNSRGYQRQKTSGKLWSRERIAQLLDPNTWEEFGSVTGSVTWRRDSKNPQAEHVESFVPSNNPQGFGQITDPVTRTQRKIYLTSDDFSIRSGHADGSVAIKTLYGEQLALRLKIPVVKLVDGSSGGGSVSTIMTNEYSYIPHVTVLKFVVQQLNFGIPNMGAVLGPAIGLGAARVVSTHFSVMAGDIGSLFNAGPKVVEGATFEEGLSFADLGGPDVHCRNGTIDNLARNEEECFTQIRTVLGYLPNCGQFEAPPTVPCSDPITREDISLRSIVPRKKTRMYNPYTIITSVVDRGSWFEIGGLWGRTGITGLARLGGRPVGILSLNCEVNSGALDAMGSQKLMKMLKFCDVFNLPVVQFIDVPGYAIGTVAERTATMKWGVELGKAYYSTTTPIFSIITRRVYGVAGGIMLDSRQPWMRIAWPSGTWGSLPLDGGIEVGHRHELKQVGEKEGPEAVKRRYKELEDEYLRLMNPVRTATHFNVEEIVDPKDTRGCCCRWVEMMYGLPMKERLADRASGKLHAVFT
ncbi:hypothetical protein H2200_007112 [Cladophialophora chaetospira]|uniref:CoA carboxyltransferase C-terminal domain-containing protein n=1 Tax=Cladophialophora chaetospira TaxID=386627 RepID=A0AA38X7A2_9EURO|nr:hypothetical protein H2200_007112 [Cladophialophora chaetospira]